MNRTTTRRSLTALALGLALAFAPAAAAPAVSAPAAVTAATATPYCGIYWGSLAKSTSRSTAPKVTTVRAGRHACFDRLVIDHQGPATGFHVRYVDQITQDGSGFRIPVRGGAKLQIITRGTRYTKAPALPQVSHFRTFDQVVYAGSFEGQTTFGLGVRARLPFRVFTLNDTGTGTSRLVIDVAHRW